MVITIDIGNSSLKAGVFQATHGRDQVEADKSGSLSFNEYPTSPLDKIRIGLDDEGVFSDFVAQYKCQACLISSTSVIPSWLELQLRQSGVAEIHIMDGNTPLPIHNAYSTPMTLGTDRLASVVGAYFHNPNDLRPALCIDCGTAITYDFITSDGDYLGGNISPGISMRLRSLHEFTSRLPLVDKNGSVPQIGNSTETAIRSGVIIGVRHEINGYITTFRAKYPNLNVFFTGGDAVNFVYPSKKCTFVDDFLVLKGLYIILEHILSKK